MPTPPQLVETFFKEKTYRSEDYKEFIRSQMCIVCKSSKTIHHHEPLTGRGIGIKGPDNEALPLCNRCHMERHIKGRETFYNEHFIDWKYLVLEFKERYEEINGKIK